jgi:hypothetical protein
MTTQSPLPPTTIEVNNASSDETTARERQPLEFVQLLADMGDLSDLKSHDVAVKFWLPTPVSEALNELRSLNGQSVSEFLRQFLAVHCYGAYAYHLMLMLHLHPDLFREFDYGVVFSNRRDLNRPAGSMPSSAVTTKVRVKTYFVPELGKNVAPMKIWMAKRMRNDLQRLADHAELKLSNYLREIVISRLFGHGTLPLRPAMLTAEPTEAAEAWCEDRKIPWREVSAHEYNPEHGRVEERWEDK